MNIPGSNPFRKIIPFHFRCLTSFPGILPVGMPSLWHRKMQSHINGGASLSDSRLNQEAHLGFGPEILIE